MDQVEKLLRVDVTPELAAAISGTYLLHVFKNSPPTDPVLLAYIEAEETPRWRRHADYCTLDNLSGASKVIALLAAYAETNGL